MRAVGGWDSRLLGGNEDYKTFFLLAELGRFSVIKSYLLGYRQSSGNRSSKAVRMLTSYDSVLQEVGPRHPEFGKVFQVGRLELIAYLFDKAVLNRDWRAAAFLSRQAHAQSAQYARAMLLRSPLIASRMILPLWLRALLHRDTAAGRMRARPFVQFDGV